MNKVICSLAIMFSSVSLANSAVASSLEGRWKLVGWTVSNAVPIKTKLPVLNFKGHTLRGTTGCNIFSAQVAFKGNVMQASNIITSRGFCGGALGEQENALMDALSQPLKVDRKADSLTLTLSNGHMLNIRRSTFQQKK